DYKDNPSSTEITRRSAIARRQREVEDSAYHSCGWIRYARQRLTCSGRIDEDDAVIASLLGNRSVDYRWIVNRLYANLVAWRKKDRKSTRLNSSHDQISY